ncbi:MAG: hypothetical protein QXJ07_04915 [Candidatus Bathyarchaeia archaeon]
MSEVEKSKALSQPVPAPEKLDQPVMTYGQMIEGQSLMRKFLKKIEIKIKGERVVTSYIWEFPDEVIAKTFAQQMKDAFEAQVNPSE